jgi:outer membrane protein
MSRPFVRALLLSLAALVVARAQTAPAATISSEQPLTLEQAIGLAVQKNFGLQQTAISLDRQKDSLEIAKSIFDPNITASFARNFSLSAGTTTQLESSSSASTSFTAGVDTLLPWTNGTLRLTTSPALSHSSSNNRFNTLNDSYNFGLGLSYTQSLRNFGREAARSNIDRTKIGVTISYINYRNSVLTLISNTETAYYSLVTARETLRIRQSSLSLAQRVFDENTARRGTGVMTDLDVLNAEVGVANARRGVIQAEEGVRNAEENLLNLINVPEFDTRPGPVRFEDYTSGVPNLAASYKLAREQYPATLSAVETLKQLQLDLDVARRNLRPNLALSAGLGYTARPTPDGYFDVIQDLPHDHGRSWNLGVTYSLPWGRRADKARLHQAQLDITSQKITLEQAEQQLSVLMRQAVRSVETNLATVEIASKATLLAEKQYEQQKARFDAGLTTSRQVQQFQDDLESTRFAELSAKLNLRRAAAELRRLEGSSIERYRIQMPQQ